MNPKRKTAQIDRLAEAIGYIATDFERFGGLFLDALLEISLNHQGTNLLGYPVGGVVDTVSDDGRVVAEYSDASGYFDSPMIKAEGDLKKALGRKPAARDIFLLSGKRKRPQIAQEFETRVGAWPDMAGKTLHLWGAEEIASRIVEELIFSDTVVRRPGTVPAGVADHPRRRGRQPPRAGPRSQSAHKARGRRGARAPA